MTKDARRHEAWIVYLRTIQQHNVMGEALEYAEIDFKAGFNAGRSAERGSSVTSGREPWRRAG